MERIQLATPSTQLVMVFCSSSDADGRQKPYTCVSFALRKDVDKDRDPELAV